MHANSDSGGRLPAVKKNLVIRKLNVINKINIFFVTLLFVLTTSEVVVCLNGLNSIDDDDCSIQTSYKLIKKSKTRDECTSIANNTLYYNPENSWCSIQLDDLLEVLVWKHDCSYKTELNFAARHTSRTGFMLVVASILFCGILFLSLLMLCVNCCCKQQPTCQNCTPQAKKESTEAFIQNYSVSDLFYKINDNFTQYAKHNACDPNVYHMP